MFRTTLKETHHMLQTNASGGRLSIQIIKHKGEDAVEYPSLAEFARQTFQSVDKAVVTPEEMMMVINYASVHVAKQCRRGMANQILVAPNSAWDLSRLPPVFAINQLEGLDENELVLFYRGNEMDTPAVYEEFDGAVRVLSNANVGSYGVILRKVTA